MAASLTAKLVGSGYERPQADRELPLDVNYAKLNEWLVREGAEQSAELGQSGEARSRLQERAEACAATALHAIRRRRGSFPPRCPPPRPRQVDRKQVPADWSRRLQAIQAKAGEAVRELPPGFLGQFEGGDDAPLDYFTAQQVGFSGLLLAVLYWMVCSLPGVMSLHGARAARGRPLHATPALPPPRTSSTSPPPLLLHPGAGQADRDRGEELPGLVQGRRRQLGQGGQGV